MFPQSFLLALFPHPSCAPSAMLLSCYLHYVVWLLSTAADIMEPESESFSQSSVFSQVQFSCAELLVTRQWHHLAVTAATETKRICTVSAYIDGQLLDSAKVMAWCIAQQLVLSGWQLAPLLHG